MRTDEQTARCQQSWGQEGPRVPGAASTHLWRSSEQGTQVAHKVVMGRALVPEDTEGTKRAETRQELRLGPACPLWAHLGPQEAPQIGEGWSLTPPLPSSVPRSFLK